MREKKKEKKRKKKTYVHTYTYQKLIQWDEDALQKTTQKFTVRTMKSERFKILDVIPMTE